MKKLFFAIVLLLLCIGFICAAGCTSQPEKTNVTPAITTAPPLPATTSPPAPVRVTPKIPTTAPTVLVTKPTRPPADPAELSKIRFSRYSDKDFEVDYPSAGNITKSVYTPYYCRNTLDPESSAYYVCYKNETKLIGPFNFYDDGNLRKQRRVVTFTSPDGRLKFVAFTADFLDGLDGTVMLKPTIEWSRTDFENNYPDLTGYASRYVGNYQLVTGANMMTASYDVTLAKDTKYYPAAYAKKTIVTPHHVYTFGFVTDSENFSTYKNLKDFMLSSITVNDAA